MVAVGFGLVIFVHELGHFLFAKKIGAKVETFSLGFGPKLIGFVRGGTDYRISLIPLGGYVKIKGQGVSAEKSESPDDFERKPVGKRMQVIVAGVAMNFLFTFPLCIAVLLIGREVPKTTVYDVRPGSPAFVAGVKPGDVVDSVVQSSAADAAGISDEQWEKGKVVNWDRLRRVMLFGKEDESIFLEVTRGQELLKVRIPPQSSMDLMQREAYIGMQGGKAKVLVAKLPDDSIQRSGAGLKEGDVIVSAEDIPAENQDLLNAVVFHSYDKTSGGEKQQGPAIAMTVERRNDAGDTEAVRMEIVTRVKGYYDPGIELYQKPLVGFVRALSVAEKNGIEPGDLITSVSFNAGAPQTYKVERWQDIEDALGEYLGQRLAKPDDPALKTVTIGVARPSILAALLQGWQATRRLLSGRYDERTVEITPEDARGLLASLAKAGIYDATSFAADMLGIAPRPGLYVWSVSERSPLLTDYATTLPPGELIAKGDRMLAIGPLDMTRDDVILTPNDVRVLVSSLFPVSSKEGEDKPKTFVVAYRKPGEERDEKFHQLGVCGAPVSYRAWLEVETAAEPDLSDAYVTYDKEDLGGAVVRGAQMPFDILALTYLSIAKMFSGEVGANQLSGPVGILQMSYKFAETGVAQFLWFLAVISVSLAVLNILPVPVLDGGHVAFLIAEKVRGKPVSEKIRGRLEIVGLVLLLGLVVFATWNDIFTRLLGH
jgi:regulator of sigma E protease